MRATIFITDQSPSGEIQQQMFFQVDKDTLTVAELLKERVCQEVETYNQLKPRYFTGLVHPASKPTPWNHGPKRIDSEEQYDKIVHAFLRNRFSILVNNQYVRELQTKIQLSYETEISFLKPASM